jgi:hypothetical protein
MLASCTFVLDYSRRAHGVNKIKKGTAYYHTPHSDPRICKKQPKEVYSSAAASSISLAEGLLLL